MRKLQLLTISAIFASASAFADVYLYSSLSDSSPWKTSGEVNGYPWGGGTFPANNDTVIYAGTFDGTTWGGKNSGFIDIDKGVEMGNFFWSSGLESTAATFTFSQNQVFVVNGSFGAYASHTGSYRGITLDFDAKAGVTGEVRLSGETWTGRTADEATTLVLNGDNDGINVKIGSGVTLNMLANKADGTQKLRNNIAGKKAGTLEAYDGGIIKAKRLEVYGSGDANHNDIIIGSGSKMEVETLAFKESDARIQVAGTLLVKTNFIANGTIIFDLQSSDASINFEGGLLNDYIGNTAIHIMNFETDAIKIAYSDEAKSIVEQKFATYDGTQWVCNLTLSKDGFVTFASIPEPAEWAAILGAIAIGFAIYRRRKA